MTRKRYGFLHRVATQGSEEPILKLIIFHKECGVVLVGPFPQISLSPDSESDVLHIKQAQINKTFQVEPPWAYSELWTSSL
jgi:hypothetical protein